jgi:hypothetical protein
MGGGGAANGFVLLGAMGSILGLASMVFWMYVGWRAMAAHERLARATERMAERTSGQP